MSEPFGWICTVRAPRNMPVTLLRMAVVHYEVEYLAGQLYFEPHPKELMLRNHV